MATYLSIQIIFFTIQQNSHLQFRFNAKNYTKKIKNIYQIAAKSIKKMEKNIKIIHDVYKKKSTKEINKTNKSICNFYQVHTKNKAGKKVLI